MCNCRLDQHETGSPFPFVFQIVILICIFGFFPERWIPSESIPSGEIFFLKVNEGVKSNHLNEKEVIILCSIYTK